jgi:hypothetical protein
MKSLYQQSRPASGTQPLHAQSAPQPRRRRRSLIVPAVLFAILSGVLAYLLTGGGGSHPGSPAAAVSSAAPAGTSSAARSSSTTGSSSTPAGHKGRRVVIPPGGETGSTALSSLGSNAMPLPAYLQAKVKAWYGGPGGTALNAVSGDLGIVTQNGGVKQYVAMKAACGTLMSAVQTAHSGPSIPYAAMQTLYSTALNDLAEGATECQAAISVKPDGDEYDETSVNQQQLSQATSEFSVGGKDLYRASAEIEVLDQGR